MADILITGVDEFSVQTMLERSERTGRPLDAVAREILVGALRVSPARRVAEADRIRAMTPSPLSTSSTDLIREDRNRR